MCAQVSFEETEALRRIGRVIMKERGMTKKVYGDVVQQYEALWHRCSELENENSGLHKALIIAKHEVKLAESQATQEFRASKLQAQVEDAQRKLEESEEESSRLRTLEQDHKLNYLDVSSDYHLLKAEHDDLQERFEELERQNAVNSAKIKSLEDSEKDKDNLINFLKEQLALNQTVTKG